MKAVETAKSVIRYACRTLRVTPMHVVLRRLRRYGVRPETLSALEVFGCDGEHHTRELASVVAKLEIWEFGSQWEPILKRRFPRAKIRITDSYAEMETTPHRYDLVVIDNSESGFPNHYEHFDLFPSIFRALANPAVIIVNLMPRAELGDQARLEHRRAFYKTAHPTNIPLDDMARTYRGHAAQHGWTVPWIFYQWRLRFSLWSPPLYYAVMRLERAPARGPEPGIPTNGKEADF